MSTDITRQLPNDEYQAAVNSNIPSVSNPFATIADIGGLIPAFTPTLNGTNIVEVTQESDFGTAVGTNIFLTANTTYFVRGVVTITTRLVCIVEGVEIKAPASSRQRPSSWQQEFWRERSHDGESKTLHAANSQHSFYRHWRRRHEWYR